MRPVCHCSSYKFPHRAGGGKCECKSGSEELCEACGQPAIATDVDFGIGSYEYWGQRCVDTNVQTVSDCCEASMVANNASAKFEAVCP